MDVLTNDKSLSYVINQKGLNFYQRIQIQLLKDYNISTMYNLGKYNAVDYALSRLSKGSIAHVVDEKK